MYDKAYCISVHVLVYYISVNDTSTSFLFEMSVRQIVLFPSESIQEVLLSKCAEAHADIHLKVMNNSRNFYHILTKVFRQISVKVLNTKRHQNPF
jgi:GTPase SAR1 family protein